jgi:hypothetical protein
MKQPPQYGYPTKARGFYGNIRIGRARKALRMVRLEARARMRVARLEERARKENEGK